MCTSPLDTLEMVHCYEVGRTPISGDLTAGWYGSSPSYKVSLDSE